ncbi:hypothetical protein GCM10010384_55840 [Streptomyces djakartensis]|uniref:Uncharacterized protein n=1 Tax=Streptomyces djakartensis TaxID=68193 RepID=A0ABQ3ABS3_9ACTN|nr:hypothetical protein GCM10010384_55840 [Streptomyces djakartensis]
MALAVGEDLSVVARSGTGTGYVRHMRGLLRLGPAAGRGGTASSRPAGRGGTARVPGEADQSRTPGSRAGRGAENAENEPGPRRGGVRAVGPVGLSLR